MSAVVKITLSKIKRKTRLYQDLVKTEYNTTKYQNTFLNHYQTYPIRNKCDVNLDCVKCVRHCQSLKCDQDTKGIFMTYFWVLLPFNPDFRYWALLLKMKLYERVQAVLGSVAMQVSGQKPQSI